MSPARAFAPTILICTAATVLAAQPPKGTSLRDPGGPPADPWRLPSGSAGSSLKGVVLAGPRPNADDPCSPPDGSPMYRRVHGVTQVVDGRVLRQLSATGKARQPDVPPTVDDRDLAPLWRIVICAKGESPTASARVVSIAQAGNGALWAMLDPHDNPGEQPASQALKAEDAAPILDAWPTYEGGFTTAPIATPIVAGMPKPYIASRFQLDKSGLGERFTRGRTPNIDGMDRLLRLEQMHLRLPRGYSPREPAGLLVWVDASDRGEPPSCLFEACDSANIAIVGIDNCGNTRPIANRYQLILDAVATAKRRCHLDDRRIYISGLSGGGRVSSILTACFPDVFTGAVPIVGLSHYEPVDLPGRGMVPPAFAKPQERLVSLLKRRRIAPVTGARDFNQGEIQAAATAMRGEGLQVKSFEALDLGHELPKPALFAEALNWVDEPYRKVRRAEIEKADRALQTALAKIGDRTSLNDADREALMRVTEIAPWSVPAWTAVERLDQPSPK